MEENEFFNSSEHSILISSSSLSFSVFHSYHVFAHAHVRAH